MDRCSPYVPAMLTDVLIAGVPFIPLHHRDGRRVRAAGMFVFARRVGDARVILHMELTSEINHRAGPGHPRWEWALNHGLNELLVCLAATSLQIGEADGDIEWHPDAEFWPVDQEVAADEVLEAPGRRVVGVNP
jgi:hypothetical protein